MILFLRGFRAFIERKTSNFIVKFREIFPWREREFSGPTDSNLIKSHFLSNLFFFFFFFLEKMVHVVIDSFFFFFFFFFNISKGF